MIENMQSHSIKLLLGVDLLVLACIGHDERAWHSILTVCCPQLQHCLIVYVPLFSLHAACMSGPIRFVYDAHLVIAANGKHLAGGRPADAFDAQSFRVGLVGSQQISV